MVVIAFMLNNYYNLFIGNIYIGSDHAHELTKISIISVTSQSTPGSLLGNVDIYINEAVITNISTLRVNEYVGDRVQHGFFLYYHNIQPTIRLTANNTFSSQMSDRSITFGASSLAKLRDTPSAQCIDGTTRYLILKLNVVLTSTSLYHLGDHEVNIFVTINMDFYNSLTTRQHIKLRVQASMLSTACIREHGSVSLCRDGQKTKWRLQCKY